MTAVKTVDLVKKYKDKTAVDKLNLEISEGEFVALLGVNGAGKTTTIKMLSCIAKPTSGDAEIMGFSLQNESQKIKEIINVSPQETAVAPNLTVRENLELMYGIYGHKKEISKTKAEETIKRYGFEEIASSKAKTLSGGWQRRLSIAMALISEPKVLFLDEPTLGLDVIARRELWNLLEKLKGKITVILTTHYLEEAKALADRIAIMSHGKLITFGTADELIKLSGKDNFEDAFIEIAGEGDADNEN